MSFRQLSWGQYAPQFADFTVRTIAGRSIIVTGAASDYDAGGSSNPTELQLTDKTDGNVLWALIKIDMDNIRAEIGQSPNILDAVWNWWRSDDNSLSKTWEIAAYRMLLTPDYTDAKFTERDHTGPVYWTYGASGCPPVGGKDHRSVAFWSDTIAMQWGTAPVYADPDVIIDMTDELAYALRAGGDLHMLLKRDDDADSAVSSINYGLFFDEAGFPGRARG